MLTPLTANPRLLRDYFDDAGYTQHHFQNRPELRDLPSRSRGNMPRILESLSEPTTLNVLLQWFFAGMPLEEEAFAGVVEASIVSMMLESGMLVREDGRFIPTVMLTPSEGLLFAADPAQSLEMRAANLVLWPNPSTRALQMFAIRRPSGITLDLGTGCGIIAILTSRHSGRVVATDLNPRATEFTRFNAWLNGVENVECLTGDTFEPVRGRAFDLIVCNPPFYITPSANQMYCENRLELDGFCRELVRGAPAFLNEDGYLQITCEWAGVRGQSWQDRLREWLKDSGCDAWVLRTYARTAADYASERLGGTMPYSVQTPSQGFAEWMAYYQDRGVEEIHGGILALRRRTGKNWVCIEDAANLNTSDPFGEYILELFANQDRLEADLSAEGMLSWKPRLAGGTHIEQQLHLVDGNWTPSSIQLRRSACISSSMALDPQVAEFLRRCDGTRTLAELAQDLAAAVRVNPEQVRQQCCAVTRKLVERRLILV